MKIDDYQIFDGGDPETPGPKRFALRSGI